jgi:hypothetical protein
VPLAIGNPSHVPPHKKRSTLRASDEISVFEKAILDAKYFSIFFLIKR